MFLFVHYDSTRRLQTRPVRQGLTEATLQIPENKEYIVALAVHHAGNTGDTLKHSNSVRSIINSAFILEVRELVRSLYDKWPLQHNLAHKSTTIAYLDQELRCSWLTRGVPCVRNDMQRRFWPRLLQGVCRGRLRRTRVNFAGSKHGYPQLTGQITSYLP